eukprot:179917-Rhodomonas_salina.1
MPVLAYLTAVLGTGCRSGTSLWYCGNTSMNYQLLQYLEVVQWYRELLVAAVLRCSTGVPGLMKLLGDSVLAPIAKAVFQVYQPTHALRDVRS